MHVYIAPRSLTSEILEFFQENLSDENDALYSPEFFCQDGLKASIGRKQLLVLEKGNQLIGALRFYRRKRQNVVSLYQYAIDKDYRGQYLLHKMLTFLHDVPIEVLCPISSKFNSYYQKTGWQLVEKGEQFNRWAFANG